MHISRSRDHGCVDIGQTISVISMRGNREKFLGVLSSRFKWVTDSDQSRTLNLSQQLGMNTSKVTGANNCYP
jgi:hypothetical protein